ncbi:MAG: ABC transporter ATP-binding protein [Alphaproteobacteria bacterium]
MNRNLWAAAPALELDGIIRHFHQADESLEVLKGASLTLPHGEIAALLGPSGSGKSTLLHIAGLLERPQHGEVIIGGQRCTHMGDKQRTEIRRKRLGFVYQYHHLLPEFSALENVILPQMISGSSKGDAKHHAQELLRMVGLQNRLSHRPARLSGGEQQRVAIARALANQPLVLLADEPTGNLDPQTAETVFALILDLARRSGLAALIATHNHDLARQMDRIYVLQNGQILEATV